MPIPEYDGDEYFKVVKDKDKAIQGYCIEDRLEQRLIRIEMLLRYVVDVVTAKEKK